MKICNKVAYIELNVENVEEQNTSFEYKEDAGDNKNDLESYMNMKIDEQNEDDNINSNNKNEGEGNEDALFPTSW